MQMIIQAILGNPNDPEYGVASIPLPIPKEEYDHCIELLEALDIGGAIKADCKVISIDSHYSVLKRLEGLSVNVDELDYLAKRLDSFDDGEAAQFQAMAHKLELFELKDLINLTFCCQQVTVITDFSDLNAVGRDHYMNLRGGSAPVAELENLDGEETARLLINSGSGTVTPYGVVYDNGMRLEQLYDGTHFPCYYYERKPLVVTLTSRHEPEDTDHITWEFIENNRFHFLHVHLTDECDLYQLNALATRLGELDSTGRIAFEGLFNQELAKKNGPITIATMIDLAYSADCCIVVKGVNTDKQLGEFCAENGFMPELDNLPDCVFQLLDFEKLGEKMRLADGGILVNRGYVSPQSDLKQVYDMLALIPKKPDYVFSLMVGRSPFETSGKPENPVRLDLPATPDELADALNACDAASWEEVVFQAKDSAIPHILDEMNCDDIDDLNELAKAIQYRQERSELPKLKAVLHAADCHSISTATFIAENLDDYLYEKEPRSVEEVGLDELRFIVDSEALKILQKHVNLYNYGNAVMEEHHSKLTPYGLVERKDGEMQMFFDEKPTEGGCR